MICDFLRNSEAEPENPLSYKKKECITRPIANILYGKVVKRAPILPSSGGNIGNSNEFKPKYIKIELEAIEYYAGRKEILLAGISRSMHIIAS